jgi:capsular exopolysaccharide synthesis family protein
MSTFSKAFLQAERDRAHQEPEDAAAIPAAPAEAEPCARRSTSPASEQGRDLGESSRVVDPTPVRASRDFAATTTTDLTGVEEHLVSLLAPGSAAAEHYRTLRHLIEALPRVDGGRVVGVTSATRGDGKTTTAINLAGALAQASAARVLLIDADLRAPAVGARLALDPADTGGLADAISRPNESLDRIVRMLPPFNLAVLPAGPPPPLPYETLRGRRLGELLGEARRQFDYVVLDTPPLVPVPDCRVLEPWVDGFFIVVAAHKTPRPLLEEALRVLPPNKVLGIVFNMDDTERRYYPYSPYAAHRNGNGTRPGRWALPWRPGRTPEW